MSNREGIGGMSGNGMQDKVQDKQQDEILYCARCGISFLWTQEEQRVPQAARPRHCPGCRALMPSPGRERGMVKWYDARKQYGFLVRAGQPDIYVHRSSIQGGLHLRPGDLVEFAVEETGRGLAALTVQLVEPAPPADPPTTPPRRR
jgi:cold shock protein